MSNLVLKYDDCSAALYDGDTCLRAFGWPKNGGHVWETVGQHGNIRNVGVCYQGSSSTILSEAKPRDTARHIAEVCGAKNIEER